jgi:hypothetical protein
VINVKVWVHFWLFVLGLIQVIYMAIDPRSLYLILKSGKDDYRSYGIMPPIAERLLWGSFFYLSMAAYLAILFHW